MQKIKNNKIYKKILSIMMLVVTLFGVVQPVFAISGSSSYVSGQFASYYFTTDNKNTEYGIVIRKIYDRNTGEWKTVFCSEHGVDIFTGQIHNGSYSTPTDEKLKKACKIAYFGWYEKYGDYIVDGGISVSRKKQYALVQQYIWETLGQSSATFVNSTVQKEYEELKEEITNKINNMQKKPSFSDSTVTIDAGTSITLTDTNGVLSSYTSIDKTVDGIRFQHSKGENTMTISVDSSCKTQNYKVSDKMMKNWGCIKDGTQDYDTTLFIEFPKGVQNQIYSLNYNDPVTLALNLKINIFGNLEIGKKDNKGNFVPNTTFKLSYNEDMSNPIGTYTTGSNGKVTVEQLKPGTVYVQEIAVPEHLILDSTIKSATVKTAETTSYTEVNQWKQGYIKVVKKDAETGEVVKQAGVVFDIYNSNNQKVTSITTNANGVATSTLLDYGTYYVKENKAPNKYTVQVEVSENIGVIENEKTYEISILNTRVKGSVSISKEDTETGKVAQGEATLEGAVYGLYAREDILNPADNSVLYKANTKVAELTTDKNANASIDNLYLGKYFLKEIKASNGYTLDTTEYDFELSYESQNKEIVTKSIVVKERVNSQAFQIIKISSDETGETDLLKGVEFTVKSQKDIEKYGSWENAPIAKNYKGQETAVLVTDEKGYAVSERLPFGTYIVRETKTPDDKYAVEDFKVVITGDSAEPQTWRIFNDKSFNSVLQIVKQDAETDKNVLVKGATFKIKNLDTEKYFGYWEWSPLPHYVNTLTTDETGKIMTGDVLEVGNYQLEEIESPYGYLISDKPVTFRISSNTAYETLPDNKTPVITVVQKDISVKGQINVEKKGEVLVDYKNGQFVYEEKGLSNAKYEIYAREDILDPSNDKSVIYKKGTLVDTVTTDDTGKATSKELPLGEYFVKECLAPENFVLSEEIKNVSLKYENQNTAVVFETISFTNERQKVDIVVNKKDKDDDKVLKGAEFSLYAKEDITNYKNEVIVKANELIETAISDENGKANFKSDIPLTDFIIKETKSPKGYVLSEETIEVNAEYKGQETKVVELEYEMKNEKMKGHIRVIKTSSEDNEYSNLPKGSPLADVTFEIYDSNENLVDTITTDETGTATSKELVIGNYKIKEISSAKYYLLNENIYNVEIEDDGTFDVEITNDNVDIDVEIEKKGFVETQSKDNIFYNFSNIRNNSNVPLDNFTWQDTLPTNAVRIDKIYTGTWNEELEYSVYYKTNKSEDYILFKDKLNTQKIYELNFKELNLQDDEYVTEYEFRFGTVKVGFQEVESPILYCDMLDNLGNGFVFTNNTKVSGTYFEKYVEDTDKWTTITYYKEIQLDKLPRTRYIEIRVLNII